MKKCLLILTLVVAVSTDVVATQNQPPRSWWQYFENVFTAFNEKTRLFFTKANDNMRSAIARMQAMRNVKQRQQKSHDSLGQDAAAEQQVGVQMVQEKYKQLQDRMRHLVEPPYADLSSINDLWWSTIHKKVYGQNEGLNKLYVSLLLAKEPYAQDFLNVLISPAALQLIAWMRVKYQPSSDPYSFAKILLAHEWANPFIINYITTAQQVFPITFYSLFDELIKAREKIETNIAMYSDIERTFFGNVLSMLMSNLDVALATKPIARVSRKNQAALSFGSLVKSSQKFEETVATFPNTENRIQVIGDRNMTKQKKIADQAQNTRPIIDHRVMVLIEQFLQHKKTYGTSQEQAVYKYITSNQFIDRLLIKRPMMFMSSYDTYLLRGLPSPEATTSFESIGTHKENSPLVLAEYLSYDEMQIAALLGVSVPTYFINNGHRRNGGVAAEPGTYQETGIYVGLVGARFEKPGLMEWQHMVVTKKQNTAEDGYGVALYKKPENHITPKQKLMGLWADFYGYPLVTYEEAQLNKKRFIPYGTDKFFDVEVYKERMKLVLKPFLMDANERGLRHGKKAYCHIVGLGLGVWQILKEQPALLVETCVYLLVELALPYISDIDFSWFSLSLSLPNLPDIKNDVVLKYGANHIKVHFSQRNPADKLTGIHKNKLLVATYAWDGNSYPGNEYWAGMLTASGDPAAACCSTIAELQNPLINPSVSSTTLFVAR